MEFQRARRPEQIEARRAAILEAARATLAVHPVAQASLREIAERAGVAKSAVLRYFPTREMVFLEVLFVEWSDWLDELEGRLPGPGLSGDSGFTALLTRSLGGRPLLCELLANLDAVLRRNVPEPLAAEVDARVAERGARLAELVRRSFPAMHGAPATGFAAMTVVLLAGLWPAMRAADAGPSALQDGLFLEGLTGQLRGALSPAVAPLVQPWTPPPLQFPRS